MTPSDTPASQIVSAAQVHTMSGARGNALLLRGGRVTAVGDLAELRRLAPSANVTEYPASTITPGLTDAHIHITEWAMALSDVQLEDDRSLQEVVGHIAESGRPRASGWLLGRGWNPHHWGGEYPHRSLLDQVVAGRPAAFQSHDMHALWVNSGALQEAAIHRHTPDPDGGRIVRDEQGEPTGVLLERAALLVMNRIPTPPADEVVAAVLHAQELLHSYGITGIHSFPGVHLQEPQPLHILEMLLEQDRLRLRVLQHLSLHHLDAAIELGLRSGLGGDWIRIGGIKMFLDGALGSRTAWMRKPYEGSTDDGVRMMSAEEFRLAAHKAARAGLANTVHAIGDAALALAFDVLTAPGAQAGTLPNRIEHVQCCPPDLLHYAAQAGIVCSLQPCHLISDWRAANRHWGAERARSTYALRSLLEHDAILAFGSDAPVEPCDPRLGFYAAVRRRDLEQQPRDGWFAEECITMPDVLRAYTVGPAIAAGAASWQGRLAPDCVADFVVWERDPLQTTGTDLLSLTVLATYVAGQPVFQND